MINHGLQTANPPLLLNHQTPLGAKVHPQRYSHNAAHDVKHFRYMTQLKSIEKSLKKKLKKKKKQKVPFCRFISDFIGFEDAK